MESKSYTSVAIILHWLMALLLLAQIAGGWYMHNLPNSPDKFELFQLHKSFGITILTLSLIRLGWRLTHKAPALPNAMAPWERMVAKLTHVLFYVLMIGVPLIGWMMVSSSPLNLDTVLFKTIPWPDFPGLPRSEQLEDVFKEMHEYMAFTILGLFVLHAGAALKHHFVNKDDVLTRMLPFLKIKG